MNDSHRKQPARRAVTLVELLVVITIMLLLAAFAIPTIRPLTEGRRVREATRAIDVYFTQAKTRALVNQRPVGVLLERFQQVDAAGNPAYQDDACTVLRMVEIPPPYSGDFTDSRLRVQNWTTVPDPHSPDPYVGRKGHPEYNSRYDTTGIIDYIVIKIALPTACLSDRILKWGDKVRFGFQGPVFTLVEDEMDNNLTGTDIGADIPVDADGYITFTGVNLNTKILTAIAPAGDLGGIPWPLTPVNVPTPTMLIDTSGAPLWSADLTFQFFRQPEPSPGDPLRLPKNTVIDLGDSGYFATFDAFTGLDAFGPVNKPLTTPADPANHRGPMILFAPNGAVSHVYRWNPTNTEPDYEAAYAATSVMNPIFLMVGKWERTGLNADGTSFADDGLHNWQDATNLWMSIGPQNGFVTTAPVDTRYLDDKGTPNPDDDELVDNVNTAGLSLPPTLNDSRRYARQQQISKGALSE